MVKRGGVFLNFAIVLKTKCPIHNFFVKKVLMLYNKVGMKK